MLARRFLRRRQLTFRSRQTAIEFQTRRSFAEQKSLYVNYTIAFQKFQYRLLKIGNKFKHFLKILMILCKPKFKFYQQLLTLLTGLLTPKNMKMVSFWGSYPHYQQVINRFFINCKKL